MHLELQKANMNLLLTIRGNIVFEECKKFKVSIVPRLDSETKIFYVDLSDVQFVDSAGLGVLVGLKMTCKKNNSSIVLLNPSKQVMDILNVAKLDSIFDIVRGPDAEEIIMLTFKEAPTIFKDEEESEKFTIKKIITKEKVIPSMKKKPKDKEEKKSTQTEKKSAQKETVNLQEEVEKLCQKAVECLKDRKTEAAAEYFLKAVELQPDHIAAHNNLAIIYEKNPEWQDKAIKEWEIVLKLGKEKNSQKHIERANQHLEKFKKG